MPANKGDSMFEIKKVVSKGQYNYAVCPDHPNRTSNNYVLLHRVLMENHLGRLLSRGEVVHHLNHDKKDNRIENLEVMTAAEHSREHAKDRPRKYVELVCPYCSSEFVRPANQTWGRVRVFCSRSCNAKFTRSAGKWLGTPKQ